MFSSKTNPLEDDSKLHNFTMETNVIQIDAENALHSSVGSQETATASENERNCLVEQPQITNALKTESLPQNGKSNYYLFVF